MRRKIDWLALEMRIREILRDECARSIAVGQGSALVRISEALAAHTARGPALSEECSDLFSGSRENSVRIEIEEYQIAERS